VGERQGAEKHQLQLAWRGGVGWPGCGCGVVAMMASTGRPFRRQGLWAGLALQAAGIRYKPSRSSPSALRPFQVPNPEPITQLAIEH
jgi:hypothetical protein